MSRRSESSSVGSGPTRIGVDTAYASHVLPSLIPIGLGFGLVIAPSFATATLGVRRRDSGVASAMSTRRSRWAARSAPRCSARWRCPRRATTWRRTGRTSSSRPPSRPTTAFWWAAAIFAVGALITGSLLRSGGRAELAHGPAEPVAA